MSEFGKVLNGRPGVISVLVGPPNCGKSTFLQELAGQLELGQNPPPVIFIDSRQVAVNGPEAISKALCDEVTSRNILLKLSEVPNLLQTVFEKFSMAIEVGEDVSVGLENLAGFIKKDKHDLNQTIAKLKDVFNALKSLPREPVIIVDEANMLMKWKEPGSSNPQLESLLAFLVSISKQNFLVHVYLATSNYFLVNWLSGQGLGEDKFKVEVLWDLTEDEAREFFFGDGVPPRAEEHWPAIYERCGGNLGMLIQCVIEARGKGSWESALRSVVAGSLSKIRRGFEPDMTPKHDELPLWTAKQWEMVLERITTAPHHAVLRDELKQALQRSIPWSWPWSKRVTGKDVLLSMVKYNLLASRPFSELARDLPREVYGDDEEVVVTLPSPGDVWAAKRILLKRKSNR